MRKYPGLSFKFGGLNPQTSIYHFGNKDFFEDMLRFQLYQQCFPTMLRGCFFCRLSPVGIWEDQTKHRFQWSKSAVFLIYGSTTAQILHLGSPPRPRSEFSRHASFKSPQRCIEHRTTKWEVDRPIDHQEGRNRARGVRGAWGAGWLITYSITVITKWCINCINIYYNHTNSEPLRKIESYWPSWHWTMFYL